MTEKPEKEEENSEHERNVNQIVNRFFKEAVRTEMKFKNGVLQSAVLKRPKENQETQEGDE